MKKSLLFALPFFLIGCSQMTPAEHIDNAKQQIQQQQYDNAIIELKNAIQLAPQDPAPRMMLGEVYLQQKEYRAAEKELSRALELGYPSEQVLPKLTTALEKVKADVALANLDVDSDKLDPAETARISYFKLQSLLRLNKQEDATRLLRRIKILDTDSAFKKLSLAYEQSSQQQYDAALDYIADVLQQAPGNQYALQQKALLLIQQGRNDEALTTYKDLVGYNPENTEATFALVHLLINKNDTATAEPYVDTLLTKNNKHPVLNYFKALSRFNDNDFKAALEHAEKALQGETDNPRYRLVAGLSAFALDDFEKADSNLSLIASDLPAGHPGLRVLAAAQLRQGKNQQAGETLTQYNQAAESDLDLFAATSYELLREGHVTQAKELLEKSADSSSSAADLARFGILQLSADDLDGVSKLEQAVKMAPELEQAQSTLAIAYLNSGQFEKAAALAEEWRKADPKSVKPLLLQGLVAKQANQLDKARDYYIQAQKMQPEDPSVPLLLVEIDAETSSNTKVIKGLEDILDKHPTYLPALSRYFRAKQQAGATQDAVERIRTTQQAQPDDLSLKLLLASAYNTTQQPDKVIELVSTITQSPKPDFALRLLGGAYLQTNKITDAEQLYRDWYERVPENRIALAGRLMVIEAKSDFDNGLALLADHESKFGRQDYTNLMTGLFLMRTGEIDKARQRYAALSEKMQQSGLAKGLLAQFNILDGQWQAALNNSMASYQVKPDPLTVRMIVGSLDKLDQSDKANQFLAAHVERFPSDQLSGLLAAERKIGSDVSNAIVQYEAMLKDNPQNFVALNNLAYLYRQEGRLDDAEDYARQAVELIPKQADARDTLAEILLEKGEAEEAVTHLSVAIDNGSTNPVIQLRYVEALMATGQKALAERKISQFSLTDAESQSKIDALRAKYYD